MKPNKLNLFILSFLVILTFYRGIIRHDVSENKYLALASEKQFDCVGQIFENEKSIGSCVLINERFVLTAAHVLINRKTRQKRMTVNGQTVIAFVPYEEKIYSVNEIYIKIGSRKIKAKNLILHPNYHDSLTKGSCDIAIIELAQTVTEIIPVKLNYKLNELHSNVIGVGYGASGIANKPETVSFFNKKIAGENVVDSISGYKYLDNETLLLCDFDHPSRSDCNIMGSDIPSPLEYICTGGDSGGGLFRIHKNSWELIGICSAVDLDLSRINYTGYYGQVMGWTRVAAFKNWINKEIK